jgi:hypothetical protein
MIRTAINNWKSAWERNRRQYNLPHKQRDWEDYLNGQSMSEVLGNLEAYDYD